MAAPKKYDAIVIGSGQGGGPLATAFAKAGRKTALIESVHVGGTCVNEGCTPTKTMVMSARVAHMVHRAADYGVKPPPSVDVDMNVVRKRKRDIVDSFRGGSEGRMKSQANLDLIMGKAKFSGVKQLEVTMNNDGQTQQLTAESIFINAGCRPAPLSIPGADQIPYLNSTSIMELDVVPEHLVVIGGGYVGVEFAQMFRRFGSRVTVVQRSNQLLGREDTDIADAVLKILTEDGLDVLLNTSPKSVSKSSDGKISLVVSASNGSETTLVASHVLGAAGRPSNADTLNLSATNVKIDGHGFVVVNERLETSIPGIYAMGDIKGGPAFTHISYDDFRILAANLLSNGSSPGTASIKDRLVPYTVFMDPQLGRIGLTENEAKKAGRKVRVAKMPMAYVARALEVDEARGMMKVLVDGETEQILGAAVLGIEGGEVMSMLQIAMMGGLPFSKLRDGVFAHPTLAESLNNLFGSFVD